MAGEMGEACNAVKKLKRGDGTIEKVAQEIADTIIYADLLAARLGIDLSQAIIKTFNNKSKEVGSKYYL
ncbi:MAG: hypothetical protein GTN53_22965 [Candidatus Aminicenantes bacterium]|nr:hypothetical protein [Candidatus Aminicenantes bacterium]NIQ69365.1 hypothetical protein [Candidatus Aminicenantes bacterium]NIT25366.1 hypothetical protein [Candidatus Aminicenantes bacterium]